MSRSYSRLVSTFWTGTTGRQIRAAGSVAQVVALYLLTSPHANMLGLYYLPLQHLSHETGASVKGVSKALQSLIDIGFCDYDTESECVWIFEMARYQVGEALTASDKRSKGVQNEYEALPSNRFLKPFFERYGKTFHMESSRGIDGPSEVLVSPFEAPSKGIPADEKPLPGARKPLRSQEQEQEQEQKDGAAHAATPSAVKGRTPKEMIFTVGVDILKAKGDSESAARSFLGKLAKQGETKLAEAIARVAADPKIDPKAYLAGCMKPREGLLDEHHL